MRFLVLTKKSLVTGFAVLVLALIGSFLFLMSSDDEPVFGFLQTSNEEVRDIHLITAEFKTTTPDGKEMEAYRWDPGTIFIEKGEKVNLKLYGINGMEHPFYIEGTDIKGTVRKGEETVVSVQFDEEGVYKLICTTHQGHAPMVGYIIVD
ncbi:MAG TPA: cupredoxin domain-containing protein [Bacillus sp. (in: firmicutes)]|uniref:cupredoxin domain-containing protein n=1 Tax=Bacillus litorisediminis TaxID=2922713 RepID=UPI001FADFDA9|nr:cupredoxin domain-containing protein [Bacillus litorisediminis]HWO76644.1 cupredoxin domain-containing protein [Bacillus sp. (in: firmicutes)]